MPLLTCLCGSLSEFSRTISVRVARDYSLSAVFWSLGIALDFYMRLVRYHTD